MGRCLILFSLFIEHHQTLGYTLSFFQCQAQNQIFRSDERKKSDKASGEQQARFPKSGNQMRTVLRTKARKVSTGKKTVRTSVIVGVGEARKKLSKRYRPLSVQALIPAGFESGKALANRSPKAFGFSMIPESVCVFVPCSGEYPPKALSTRP